ncbi:MAG: fused MFS/spermidine synthase [Acidobacteriia bacterium]|nr:fused MFS/spermidine synthase [Terriglobia bacterium]
MSNIALAAARQPFIVAILSLIGFTAVICQIVLMRELLVVFQGNELALGVMLANWLLWTALGSSLLGIVARRVRDARRLVAALEVAIALALPLTILAARASRLAFHALPGETLGPVPIFLTSFATLSVLCLISGGLFAAGSRLFAEERSASTAQATSAVYLFEAVGSGVGGLLASLLLIRFLDAFEIAALLALLNLLAAASVGIRGTTRRRAAIMGLLALALALPLAARTLEARSLALLWRGFELVEVRNSIYGNLAVVRTGASRSLFENGLRILTVPDRAAAEEAVHYALLEHPAPRNLLLIGGGVNGGLTQALQHPSLARVDYVELDPTILDLAAQRFPEVWSELRKDARVQVHPMDGRLFLKTTARTFDVILVNLPDPHTAQLNRFYTAEFFREAKQKLNPGGIFSFQVTASEDYISPELADLLRCLEKTLRSVFPEVAAMPGGTVHFFAALEPGTLTTDSGELLKRLRARQLRTTYVREYYLPYRVSPDRMLDLQLQLESQPGTPINRDFVPIAYYFDVALWSGQFPGRWRAWFESVADVSFGRLFGGVVLVLSLLLAVAAVYDRRKSSPLSERRYSALAGFCVAAMGFTLLGLELLLLLGFQALYGYVYQQLAILIALFMVGMALGARLALPSQRRAVPSTAVMPNCRRDLKRLILLQLSATASPLILYMLFTKVGEVGSSAGLFVVSQILFPALALASGLLGGYQFPLASRLYFSGSESSQHSLGALYGLDLLGACLGAIALSIYLVPVYGFLRTALLMGVVSLAPAVLAVAAVRESPAHHP